MDLTLSVFDSVAASDSQIGAVVDGYSESNENTIVTMNSAASFGFGQAFAVGSAAALGAAKAYLRKTGSPTGNVVAVLYNLTGTFGTNAKPTGAALATSDPVDASTLATSLALVLFPFRGANQYALAGGSHYGISFEYNGGDGSNRVDVGIDTTSPTHAGNHFIKNSDSSWTPTNTRASIFYVYDNQPTLQALMVTLGVSVSDSVTAAEYADPLLNLTRNAAAVDAVTAAENVGAVAVLNRSVFDSVTAAENVQGAIVQDSVTIAVFDSVTAAEAVTPTLVRSLLVADNVTAADPSYPFGLIDSYSEANYSSSNTLRGDNYVGIGQCFTATAAALGSARFYLNKVGAPTGNMVSKLYAMTGTFGTNGKPTGAALAASDPVDASTLSTSFSLVSFPFTAANQVALTNGAHYVVTVEYSGGGGANGVNVGFDSTSPTHAGNDARDFWPSAGTWAYTDAAYDICFYVYSAASAVVAASAWYVAISDSVIAAENVARSDGVLGDGVTASEAVSARVFIPTATRYSLILP